MSREQFLDTLWRENRTKICVLTVLVVLAIAMHFAHGLWLQPQVEASRTQLLKVQDDIYLVQQRIAEGGGEKITGIAEDLEQFYKTVPQQSGLGNFIGRLYSYADEAGIDIAQISYTTKSVEATKLFGYQLNFSVSGRYDQLKLFIHQLENSPSILILDRITLNSSQQEKTEVVSLQIELKTYFQGGEL